MNGTEWIVLIGATHPWRIAADICDSEVQPVRRRRGGSGPAGVSDLPAQGLYTLDPSES